MSYINFRKHLDQWLSSQGDGTGDLNFGLAGKTITGATTASPVVCTSVAHGYVSGDWLWIDSATGTTEINGLREVVKINNDTFSLLDENGDAVNSTGTFGGTVDSHQVAVYKPTSSQVAHVSQLSGTIADATWVADGMAGVTRLTNPLTVAIYNGSGVVKTLATVYGWSDWNLFCGGLDVGVVDVTNTIYESSFNWPFRRNVESNAHNTDLRIDGTAGEFLVAYCEDDLDGLVGLRYAVQGYME